MRFVPRPLLFFVLALTAVGCRTASVAPAPTPETTPVPSALLWAETSAEYHAVFAQTFRAAGERLGELVADRPPGSWAVSVDADETLLSNRPFQWWLHRKGLTYDPDLWSEWVAEERAEALPGAREFLLRVRSLGGKIAVVTNRRERDCPATRRNLEGEGLAFDVVLCKPPDEPEKEQRWSRIERGTAAQDLPPLEIVLWVGDNIRDFPELDQGAATSRPELFERFGDDFFAVPNPMYGSWHDNEVPPDVASGQ